MNSKVLKSISSNVAGLQLITTKGRVSEMLDKISDDIWNVFLPYHCTVSELSVCKMATRSWILLVSELSEQVALSMCARIFSQRYTLVSLITEAEACYDCFTREEIPENNLFQPLLTCSEVDYSLMASCLRYLSRFCPSRWQSEKLSGATIDSFLELQRELQGLYRDQWNHSRLNVCSSPFFREVYNKQHEDLIQKHGMKAINYFADQDSAGYWKAIAYSSYTEGSVAIFSMMRDHYWELDYYLSRWIRKAMEKPARISKLFTTGAVSDAQNKIDNYFVPGRYSNNDKLVKALRLEPYLPVLAGVASPLAYRAVGVADDLLGISWDVMQCMCVPKNYKKCRVIAPCSTVTSAVGKHLFDALARIMRHTFSSWSKNKRRIKITYLDQMQNRDLAYLGSIDGNWDTLDLKNASDRNRIDVLQAILPSTFNVLRRYLPRYFGYKNLVSCLYSFALAGFPATYLLECLYFWLGGDYSEYILEKFSDNVEGEEAAVICGDDIVSISDLTETLRDILHIMGCEVNVDKSFHGKEDLFRESCGGYFKRGFRIDPIFFPRRGIALDSKQYISDTDLYGSSWNPALNESELHTSLSTAVALANSLVEYPAAHMEVCTFILEHTPEGVMTASTHDQETGLRTPYITLEQSVGSNYAYFTHEYVKGKQLPDGRYTLQIESTLHPDNDSRLLDKEVYRKFWKPSLESKALVEAYGTHRCSPGATLSTEVHSRTQMYFDWFLYQIYLDQGPAYDDPLMELLRCSTRRRIF
jgi:hypothetical protein